MADINRSQGAQNRMNLTGTPVEIQVRMAERCPEVYDAIDRVRQYVPFIKREVLRHEAAVLYVLATGYNRNGANFLEIGTAWGYSAAVMAEAAPAANIVTLNPKFGEWERAIEHLKPYANVIPLLAYSWDYLDLYRHKGRGIAPFDFIFVDGGHGTEAMERDLEWWDRLRPGGLILFHDYSPDGSGRPCPSVYDAVNEWQARLRLTPDVLVTDDRGIGMVGYKKE